MKNRSQNTCLASRIRQTRLLYRSIPSPVVVLFTVSVVVMNLLANKTILDLPWIALDGGILISWMAFLCMDVVTKHFGPRAANKLSLFAVAINLLVCAVFFLVSIIPSKTDYTAFNTIFRGTWFILLSSTVAFIASAILNNLLNYLIGRFFRKNPDGFFAFISRAYISTFISQFFDNLIFALLTFTVFAPVFWDGFSWSVLQCVTCSLFGAIAELLMEVIFSPIGYKISKEWKEDGVGKEYFESLAIERKGRA